MYLTSKCCVVLTDLGNFSGRTRSAVSVREGQGVVLMCSPPPHSPGTVPVFHVTTSLVCCFFILLDCATGDHAADMCMAVMTCMSSYWSYTWHSTVFLWYYCFLPILSTAVIVLLPPLVSNIWSRVQEPWEVQRRLTCQNWVTTEFLVSQWKLHGSWLMVLLATVDPSC